MTKKLFAVGLLVFVLAAAGTSVAIAMSQSQQPDKTVTTSMLTICGLHHYS